MTPKIITAEISSRREESIGTLLEGIGVDGQFTFGHPMLGPFTLA